MVVLLQGYIFTLLDVSNKHQPNCILLQPSYHYQIHISHSHQFSDLTPAPWTEGLRSDNDFRLGQIFIQIHICWHSNIRLHISAASFLHWPNTSLSTPGMEFLNFGKKKCQWNLESQSIWNIIIIWHFSAHHFFDCIPFVSHQIVCTL